MSIDITFTAGVGYRLTKEQAGVIEDYLYENDMVAEELNTEHISLTRYGLNDGKGGYVAFFDNDDWKVLTLDKYPDKSLQGFEIPLPDTDFGMSFPISDQHWRQLDVFFESLNMIPEDEEESSKFYDDVLENTRFYLAADVW